MRGQSVDFGGVGCSRLEEYREDLGNVGVREEGDARAGEGAPWSVGGGEEGGGVRVGEELGDDGRLCDNVSVIGERRN